MIARITLIALALAAFPMCVSPAMGAPPPASASTNLEKVDVDQLRDAISVNPERAAAELSPRRVDALIAMDRADAVHELCLSGIVLAPHATQQVEQLQTIRVMTHLRTGHPAAALMEARRLFNVCRMQSTGKALRLIERCLQENSPTDLKLPVRFIIEQSAGAELAPADRPATSSPIMSGIRLGEANFADELRFWDQDDEISLHGRGNLLLLANRPAEAKAVFEKLLGNTTGEPALPMIEDVARAIRAQDGTIGRANAYVMAATTAHTQQR